MVRETNSDTQSVAAATGAVIALDSLGLLRGAGAMSAMGTAPPPPPPARPAVSIGSMHGVWVSKIQKFVNPPILTYMILKTTTESDPIFEVAFPPNDEMWIPELDKTLTIPASAQLLLQVFVQVTAVNADSTIATGDIRGLKWENNLHPEWSA